MDPVSRREFWRLIYSLSKEGTTVLVTTHYMDEAELCQRVGLMSHGRLVALDTPDVLKKTQMRGQVLEINTDAPEQALLALRSAKQTHSLPLEEVALYGSQVHAAVLDASAQKEAVLDLLNRQSIRVHSIDWITPTLEDVFISFMSSPDQKNVENNDEH